MSTYLKTIPIVPENNLAKRVFSPSIDIGVMVWTKCNLNCTFCCLKPYKKFDFDPSRLRKYYNQITKIINQYKSRLQIINVQLQGGELFGDFVTDEALGNVGNFITQLTNYAMKVNIEIGFCAVSNLVYHNVDRVIAFCKKYNVQLDTSFDFEGRFTKQRQIDLWWNNLQKIKESGLNPSIAIIETKQAIEYVQNKDPMFAKLYSNFVVKFEPYDDVNQLPNSVVTPEHHAEFIKYLILHYPKCEPASNYLHAWLTKTPYNEDQCDLIGIDCLPDQTWMGCCDKYHDVVAMMKFHQCISCEYFKICAIPCPHSNNAKQFCYNKLIFDFIKQHNDSISYADIQL